jgi:c-di-GMP-binding flagellar brake protein YcgR
MREYFSSDRRKSHRFPIECELVYRVIDKRRNHELGRGVTIDISSGGIRFRTDRPLVAGRRLEIAIRWPVQLDDRCDLKLMARGRVVRSEGNQAAIEIQQYEFRTMGRNGLSL